jgi:hypothetical protein
MSSIALTQEPEIEQVIYSEPENTVEEDFRIDDQEKASWAARRILHAQKTIEERKATAKRFKERIDTWLAQSNEPDEKTIERLSSLLQPYLEEQLKDKKGKSIKVFGATITLRKQPEKVSVFDKEKALAYCEEHAPNALIIKKELSKTELKKLSQDGTLIPGVLLDGGDEKLYVKE